ncbi:tubulin binding cofactor C-domain-containing protein [Geopyxis carbonaria]|nr:tubulin binding cofactor C-domain-containing protein [Geopyxis carbonaria]
MATCLVDDTIDDINITFKESYEISPNKRPAVIDQCLASITEFSDRIKDASPYLPAYDQRAYSLKLKGLSAKLSTTRQALTPKKKFSFKSRRNQNGNIGGDFETKVTDSTTNTTLSEPEAENISITSRVTAHIHPPLTTTIGYASLLLSDLCECIVNFPNVQFGSASLKNIDRSLLILDQVVNGPAHITGVTNSTLVLSCHQFRMHKATNVDVYLMCTSQPIIEDCQGIRFAPYKENTENLWDKVSDFKWLRNEKSPHWSILPENERHKQWPDIGRGDIDEAKMLEILGRFVQKAT